MKNVFIILGTCMLGISLLTIFMFLPKEEELVLLSQMKPYSKVFEKLDPDIRGDYKYTPTSGVMLASAKASRQNFESFCSASNITTIRYSKDNDFGLMNEGCPIKYKPDNFAEMGIKKLPESSFSIMVFFNRGNTDPNFFIHIR